MHEYRESVYLYSTHCILVKGRKDPSFRGWERVRAAGQLDGSSGRRRQRHLRRCPGARAPELVELGQEASYLTGIVVPTESLSSIATRVHGFTGQCLAQLASQSVQITALATSLAAALRAALRAAGG